MNHKQDYWGDIPRSSTNDYSLSSSDADDLLNPRLSTTVSVLLHQPSSEPASSFQILAPEFCCCDQLVLHTVKVLHYQRQIMQLISQAQTVGAEGGNLSPCPAIPEEPYLDRKAAKSHFLNFLCPESTQFTSGKKRNFHMEVESATARLILRKSVATVCAHTGYTDTTESVLQFLTDITHEFLTKLTHLLRVNTDAMQMSGNCPFHDLMEQTLHDIGLGSMSELHKMYKERVIDYHARVYQEAEQLQEKYQNILTNFQENSLSARWAHIRTFGYKEDILTVSLQHETSNDFWFSDDLSSHVGAVNTPGGPASDEMLSHSVKSNSNTDLEVSSKAFHIHNQVDEDKQLSPMSVPCQSTLR